MTDTMTPRERWKAAVRMEPVDRLPFWAKLPGNYPGFHGAPFSRMTVDALHEWIGSDPTVHLRTGIRTVHRRASVNTVIEGDFRKTEYRIGGQCLTLVSQIDHASFSWHPIRFPVKTRDEINILADVFEDSAAEVDPNELAEAREQSRRVGERTITAQDIGESPLMVWVEWLAGIQNAHYLLNDFPADVERLFEAIHRDLVRKTEILSEHGPADVFYLTENTSTTLISPEQYRRYCARHISEYVRIVRNAGRHLILHMCGHLKALLPDLARIPVSGFEAFTTPTVGNTTLAEGRRACPDKCLIGGTNAALWLEPAEAIIARIEAELDALPHHRGIVVSSAGMLPQACRPETVKRVAEWVKGYRVVC
ncbi:MAG TPA: uroporphyrinogen decarboxylase family protein [Candidatus Latescibacteria bacterium]|nr:uroporphyrinogen decarboxylase family protein [Candidatus Latescibacterota bacterium]HOS64391.1 uroporphyrinogen decarboxylase family protein [Candidatus Latescibacterota bacterium]HPK75292.1 uroporphyrinogen decarboxylase family protein [Candidatus Latescibacterota bacterium]